MTLRRAPLVLGVAGLLLLVGGLAAGRIGVVPFTAALGLAGMIAGAIAAFRRKAGGAPAAGIATSALAFSIGGYLVLEIPSHSRMHREQAAAISETRAVTRAQLAYAKVNGRFDSLECLAAPRRCIAGYEGEAFLDPYLLRPQRHGYAFTLHRGASATFAYVAIPAADLGYRSYCGDDRGGVCAVEEGQAPSVVGGRCGAPCTPLDRDR
jgi:hypothetical protein